MGSQKCKIKPSRILVLTLFACLLAGRLDGQSEVKAIDWVQKALLAKAVDQWDSARLHLMHAEKLALLDSTSSLLCLIYLEEAKIFRKKKQPTPFLQALSKAEQCLKPNPDHPLWDEWFTLQAQYKQFNNDLDGAISTLKEVEKIRQKSAPFENWKTYRFLASIYREKKKTGVAKEYQEKAENLAESQNTLKILTEVNALDKGELTDMQVLQIQLENVLINAQHEKDKNKNRFLLLLVIFTVLVSLVISYFFWKRSQWHKKLFKQHQIIQQNLAEKEVLVQEIHHRVKNNLQLISSLLSLQSRTLKDDSAVQALHESQSRVLSMALIHQNLYKSNAESGLEVRDYVLQLTQQLLQTYGIDPGKIDLELDIEPISLDVHTLVPLALIINELIANALKYAFNEVQEGKIAIDLKETKDKNLKLAVRDNGKGFHLTDYENGFGLKLIRALAEKLDAEITMSNQGGAMVELLIKNYTVM